MSKLPQLVRWLIVMVVLSPLGSVHLMGAEQYPHGPDSQSQDGIPKGSVTKFTWDQSSVFPGTIRDYWVYVPAQYDEDRASPVMVFQDGANFIRENGDWRVPTVFDNLIH
ncbi:MAG: esterase family protein, partial [Verrucomicrobia bacterium]|nr:esterase family protein [Verrucomicrobiota bacterium]